MWSGGASGSRAHPRLHLLPTHGTATKQIENDNTAAWLSFHTPAGIDSGLDSSSKNKVFVHFAEKTGLKHKTFRAARLAPGAAGALERCRRDLCTINQ